ncbi:ribonucleoside-triphosphate reductase, adenosylcobalamin-dependent [Microcoleus sp. B9-D4]|uniref:ribonucleoside-triphosphate reductase, adenosylcobalamin-dependent n=1 Tax=Microcoleus sp. B9-D4 TaxID=2818711 RepID=UPI002FD6D4E7
MVRELERSSANEKRNLSDFPETAPAANPVFFRTYSRRTETGRETWAEVCDRTVKGLQKLGNLTPEETQLLHRMQNELKTLASGRWLWVGGSKWIEQPENFSGAYNCSSTNILDWRSFGLLMDLAMMGCGTGAVLEPQYINQLPPIRNRLTLTMQGEIGSTPAQSRRQETEVKIAEKTATIYVGDSRQGWVQSYQTLLELSTDERFAGEVQVFIDLSDVRPVGEPLKGFGGVANPVKLPDLYQRCAAILNKALGRQLNSVECCVLIDEAAVTIVAGNIRRSAGMRQFSFDDELGANAKNNLWQQDESGNWRIDPERDALRMANHTRVFHTKPTLEECIDAVRKQYYSGEGAIQWAGEAVARSNVDLLSTPSLKLEFLKAYDEGKAKEWLQERHPNMTAGELEHRLVRVGLNPCGEIIGSNFHCVSGDTLLITRDGLHKIKDVLGTEIEIWNGKRWSCVTPFKTASDTCGGRRKLYRVKFGDGTYLDATEYHRFFVKDRFGKVYREVQTKDLMDTSRYSIHTEPFTIQYEDGLNIDSSYAYTLGVAVGDGTTDKNDNAKVRLYEHKMALSVAGNKSPERSYDYLPAFTDVTNLSFSGELLKSLKVNPEALNVIASWNRQAILHFIAGLADTDGSNTHSNGIRIYISDRDRAFRVQLLLTKCGIRSSLNLCAHQGSITNYGVRSRDLYYLQITECGEIPCQRLDVSKGTNAKHKGKWQVVRSVEELPGLHDTYCFNEPEFHKGVFGNTLAGNCNLAEVHLNQLDPYNFKEQEEAFKAAALSVAVLLNHKFLEPRYQYSRELDPIVGVSFTGLFDFFVHAFGVEWLRWWVEGRPQTPQGIAFKQREEEYLSGWRQIVDRVVWDYCDRHSLKRPNRCTTVQPSGTKSLLTGASPGWHPPKAQRFIRRITFGKNDPVALACIDYGYNVIPSQSDKDENGNLLNNPFDERCTEWLVEIPVAVSWADLPGADEIDINKFSAAAQMDFYMQVQKFYVRHNTSATIELRENEVESLGTRIYEAIRDDEGYISAALLARFDALETFPRLPFEPINKETYTKMVEETLARREIDVFHAALSRYDLGEMMDSGPAGCDSDKCLMPETK